MFAEEDRIDRELDQTLNTLVSLVRILTLWTCTSRFNLTVTFN